MVARRRRLQGQQVQDRQALLLHRGWGEMDDDLKFPVDLVHVKGDEHCANLQTEHQDVEHRPVVNISGANSLRQFSDG